MDQITTARRVLGPYGLPGDFTLARYGQGHINDTYLVTCPGKRYILQGLSTAAFPRQTELMENFIAITAYLRRQILENGGDPDRETLSLVKTREGLDYVTDNGRVWRLMPFIEGTVCCQQSTPQLFEASARAFGNFQYMLRDYPAHTLHETIQRFHDTPDRFRKFLAALRADPLGRAGEVRREIDFVLARQPDCSVAMDALARGELPLRVTHNDTKLNNILLDEKTCQPVCVIDLDTTMPGLSIHDFGDSIRFGANHCAEDEKDLTRVNFDLELYHAYAQGFLTGCRGSLTQAELHYLPWGAKLMTLECGIRFLTDYLEGDHYFHTQYPGQNLDRCRTQFKLVQDMEGQFDKMTVE